MKRKRIRTTKRKHIKEKEPEKKPKKIGKKKNKRETATTNWNTKRR